MNTLILGGAGFIGKNLIRELSQDPSRRIVVIDSFINSEESVFRDLFPTVQVINLDVASSYDFTDVLRGVNPGEIFHLAANSDIRLSSVDPMHDLKNTFMTTARLVSVLPSLDNPSVFFASSSAVYGPKDGPVSEDSTPNPISSYGWMKYTSEVLLNDSFEQGVIRKLVIFRFPNVVGQYMTHGVIFDLINKIRLNPRVLDVLGDGSQEKPYVLASDLAKIVSQSVSEKLFASGTYNISTNDRSQVCEIVNEICRISELTPTITYGSSRSGWNGDVAEYQLVTDKINLSVLSPIFVPSAKAIEAAIKFYWQETR